MSANFELVSKEKICLSLDGQEIENDNLVLNIKGTLQELQEVQPGVTIMIGSRMFIHPKCADSIQVMFERKKFLAGSAVPELLKSCTNKEDRNRIINKYLQTE